MNDQVQWFQANEIDDLFIGRSIVTVDKNSRLILLSDGTELEIIPNEGACCGGWYELKSLASCENIITSAKVRVESFDKPKKQYKGKKGKKGVSSPYEDGKIYSLFVYADNVQINAATVEGDDGSGYYGTGFTISVKAAK